MITVSKRATQANTPFTVYRARTEEDIYHCVSTVCNGKNRGSMFIESTDYDPLAITNEMINIQTLYNKCKGIRVRGVYLTITKDEFPNFLKMPEEMDEIARRFCSYIAFQGYQTIYKIKLRGEVLPLLPVINSAVVCDLLKMFLPSLYNVRTVRLNDSKKHF